MSELTPYFDPFLGRTRTKDPEKGSVVGANTEIITQPVAIGDTVQGAAGSQFLKTDGSGKLVEGGQEYEEFVFNSSGTQSGRVYNDFEDLIDFINFMGSPPTRITFLQNETLPAKSSGDYNLTNIMFRGLAPAVLGGAIVTLGEGFTFSSWQNGGIETLGLIHDSSTTGCDYSGILLWNVLKGSTIYSSSAPLWTLSAGVAVIFIETVNIGADIQGSPLFDVDSSVFFIMNFTGNSFGIEPDTIQGSGTVIMNVGAAAPVSNDPITDWDRFLNNVLYNQTLWTGTINPSWQVHGGYITIYRSGWSWGTFDQDTIQEALDNLYNRFDSDGLLLTSPDSTVWRVTVDNDGNLTTTAV